MSKPKYDSSVARMAGNIAAGMMNDHTQVTDNLVLRVAVDSVRLARAIVAEVQRTEPVVEPQCGENIAGTKTFCTLVLDHVGPCGHTQKVGHSGG